jgi:hypothetical protein
MSIHLVIIQLPAHVSWYTHLDNICLFGFLKKILKSINLVIETYDKHLLPTKWLFKKTMSLISRFFCFSPSLLLHVAYRITALCGTSHQALGRKRKTEEIVNLLTFAYNFLSISYLGRVLESAVFSWVLEVVSKSTSYVIHNPRSKTICRNPWIRHRFIPNSLYSSHSL